MEVVEALKDISQIEAMKKYLKEHSQRDYLLFVIGINTGLKITELLSMKFEEVLNEDKTVKEFYSLPVKDEKFKQEIESDATFEDFFTRLVISSLKPLKQLSQATNIPIESLTVEQVIQWFEQQAKLK